MNTALNWAHKLNSDNQIVLGAHYGPVSEDQIQAIQLDAYEEGRRNTMEHVSKFCREMTERLADMNREQTKT